MNPIYAIDFDGTIVTHEYPNIGKPVPYALDALRLLQEGGARLILWTMRSGQPLQNAVDYLEAAGIELWGINENPEQGEWTDSPKVYALRYIDDAAAGVPLIYPPDGLRPYLDWLTLFPNLDRQRPELVVESDEGCRACSNISHELALAWKLKECRECGRGL